MIDPEVHPTGGPINMGEVVAKVSKTTGDKAVLVTDVGQNEMMGIRYFRFSERRALFSVVDLGLWGSDCQLQSELHLELLTVWYVSLLVMVDCK